MSMLEPPDKAPIGGLVAAFCGVRGAFVSGSETTRKTATGPSSHTTPEIQQAMKAIDEIDALVVDLSDEHQPNPKGRQAAGGDQSEHGLNQRQQAKAQRQQIERVWAMLKKEKAALIQERHRLKLYAQSLENRTPASNAGPSLNQERLEQYRRQLQEQFKQLRTGEAVVDLARQQYAELLEQRQVLVETKRFLCSYEQELKKRWSVHRGVGLVGGVVSCLLFLLLFGYGVGHRIVQPVWQATTVVGITATVFDESRYGPQWLTQQHQLLVSNEILSESIRLGAQRGIRLFGDPNQMREALSRGLSVELVSPGRISLTLRHTDRPLAVNVLKSVGRALVNHHTTEDRVSGLPNSMRVYQAAAHDPQPVEDPRWIASLVTLLLSLAVVVVAAFVASWWLSRSVEVFQQQAIPEFDELEDDDLWPVEPAAETPLAADLDMDTVTVPS